MSFLTEGEMNYFRDRYRNANPEATLQYAIRCAEDYADTHARNAPAAIKTGVAQLHFRHVLQGDRGERALIRQAIDTLLGIGRGAPCSQ